MREDYGSLPLTLHDDGFGDIGFDADGPDFIRDHVDPNIDVSIGPALLEFDFAAHLLYGHVYVLSLGSIQGSLLADDDHLVDRTLKEPMPGTSRSMMELDARHMISDDTFTGDPFEREYIGTALPEWKLSEWVNA